jgi:hypothetical protein
MNSAILSSEVAEWVYGPSAAWRHALAIVQ